MSAMTRDATAADLPEIDRTFRDVFRETFEHLYRPEDLAAFFAQFTPEAWQGEFNDPGYHFRIAEAYGEIAGFLKLGPSALPVETEKRVIELRQIYIRNAFHGAGLAKALTDWAIGEARRQGFEELYLTVYVDNHRARRFYQRYGFEEIGPYAFMVGEQADEDIIMRLSL